MERTGSLLHRQYNSLLGSTLAMTASMYLAGILDSIMVGRMLGTLALSAISLSLSVSFLTNIPIALFTFGGNTLAVTYKGRRDRQTADKVFTLSFLSGVLSAVAISLVGIILIRPVSGLLSQHNEALEELIAAYLLPLLVLPLLTAVLNPTAAFARTDGMTRLSTAMPIIANVINLLCDWLFMGVLHMGIAGAGWATVAGYLIGCLLAIGYFRSPTRSVRFTRVSGEQLRLLSSIAGTGMPSALIYACNFLRLFFTNYIILSATGTVGAQIASVSFSLNSLAFIFVEGASMTLLPLLGALYGERDIRGMRLALRYGMLATLLMCGGILLLSELLPVQLASLYGLTDPEIVGIFSATFRIVSINIPLLGVIYVIRTFFQATKQKGLANLLVILDGFAVVVPLMWAFSKIDIYWLWASFPISKLVTVLLIAAAVAVVKYRTKADNLLLLEGEDGEVLDFTIHSTVASALEASAQVVDFCNSHGVDSELSMRLGVATEELCVNTARYAGTPTGAIDVYVKIADSFVILKLRDDGAIFNPTDYVDDSGEEITGLAMVRAVSSKIEYSRVIGFNVTVVTVDR